MSMWQIKESLKYNAWVNPHVRGLISNLQFSAMKKINIVLWGIGQHSINKILPAINNCKLLNLYGLFSRNKKVLNKNKKTPRCNAFVAIKQKNFSKNYSKKSQQMKNPPP